MAAPMPANDGGVEAGEAVGRRQDPVALPAQGKIDLAAALIPIAQMLKMLGQDGAARRGGQGAVIAEALMKP